MKSGPIEQLSDRMVRINTSIGPSRKSPMPLHTITYQFEQSPRSQTFELAAVQLPEHEAAMHLIELHFGDSENSLNMPNADASPDEVMRQAEVLGLTDIKVHTQA
jgi:hypothetical protein